MAKGPQAFRTISEASDELDLPQHVLRFWETRFPFIKPLKRAGGRRFYRPQDIAVLGTIKRLLHEEGYKIEGVQRLYREQGIKRFAEGAVADEAPQEPEAEAGRAGRLRALLASLREAKAELDRALASA